MLILYNNSPSTKVLGELLSPNLGGLVTPRSRHAPSAWAVSGKVFGMDNDCFQGLDRIAFIKMLKRFRGVPGCLWVVAPDVVAQANATLMRFNLWYPVLRYYDYRIALVAQDGLEHLTVPWDRFECLFIGGSTAWKLGPAAMRLAKEAKARGKWVHMGRVNSRRRMEYAGSIGCDSVDGTGFSKFSRKMLPWGLGMAKIVQTRMDLVI